MHVFLKQKKRWAKYKS